MTNSFHGTAFSINFGKQFYTIIPNGKSNNSRQKSILKLMGCEERLLVEGDEFPDDSELRVDNAPINRILEQERMKSIKFLNEAIHGK